MIFHSITNDPNRDSEQLVTDKTSQPEESLSAQETDSLTEMVTQSDHEQEKPEESESKIALPEPDAENITVLTHKLPNKPILPWNRYDSPWEESEHSEKTDKNHQNSTFSSSSEDKEAESTLDLDH